MNWEIVGPIVDQETIAIGNGIRQLKRVRRLYGGHLWRKREGIALIRYVPSGPTAQAERHWYDAHGIGKVEMKIKALL